MIDWTDRHCRYFHRVMTKRALLYTEMIVADAVIHGDRERLLGDATAGPVALQLGGSDPDKLAEAARIGTGFGYREINLNVGCPSDRVQSGTFGACLMREPALVGQLVEAMKRAVDVPVTVKCRLGVDDQDTGPALDDLARAAWNGGADGLWVHARKAWLEGLSPRENREIPPLDYARVGRLKAENPNRFIGLNGGLQNLDHALEALNQCGAVLDGAMLGRAAYQSPALLREADGMFFAERRPPLSFDEIIGEMAEYADRHIAAGGRLHHVTRHMIGLFQGVPGARQWRQTLSGEAVRPDAAADILRKAYLHLRDHAAPAAASGLLAVRTG
ncbi:MAG: tRNA dihydrouridine(20/20a) synthase DusA [Nitratireductor sp.]|nr:tRNA dihydrouridine(20/20a) synthase DusA [Nitratireductor sp.]